MEILEQLKKQFVEFKFNKYAKTMPAREASIAAKFALDDMVNQYNSYKKNVSEQYALAIFQDELNFMNGK
jgi:hypothetical protein